MKIYNNYQEIKNDYKDVYFDVFTDYVMDIINLDMRHKIRKEWQKSNKNIEWQNYLLSKVNFIKQGLKNKNIIRLLDGNNKLIDYLIIS